jgi:RNA 2',3'-cyclic 3'-phosphodiesterase
MSDQLDLPGLGPAVSSASGSLKFGNLFLALLPPGSLGEVLFARGVQLKTAHSLYGKPRPAQLLHVSLVDLGGIWSRTFEDAVRRVVQSVNEPTFKLVFDRALSFKSRDNPFVLATREDMAPLASLHAALRKVLAHVGVHAPRTITPHITLLYDKYHLIDEHPIEPIVWTPDEFVLIHSHSGQSRYDVIDRWPLKK